MSMQLRDKTIGALAAAVLGTVALVASLPVAVADQSPPQERAALVNAAQAAQAAPNLAADGGEATDGDVQAKIQTLHDRLHITTDQKQQWEAIAAVMRSNAEAIGQLVQKRAQDASMMSAVDDLRSYQEISAAHAEGLNRLVPAFEALYDTMSDDQKKNADVVFGHLHRHAAPEQPPR